MLENAERFRGILGVFMAGDGWGQWGIVELFTSGTWVERALRGVLTVKWFAYSRHSIFTGPQTL